MTNNDKLLTEKQVLAIIPVSRVTWLNGVTDGKFPSPIFFGRRRFWRKEEIDKLFEEGTK